MIKIELMFQYGTGFNSLVHAIYKKRKSIYLYNIWNSLKLLVNTFGLWKCIEPIDKSVFGIYISEEKLACYWKISLDLVEKYGKHAVFTNGCTWYPEACNFLHLKHIAYFLINYEKLNGRIQEIWTIQYNETTLIY